MSLYIKVQTQFKYSLLWIHIHVSELLKDSHHVSREKSLLSASIFFSDLGLIH